MALFDYLYHWILTPHFWIILVITWIIKNYLQQPNYHLPPRPYSYPLIGNFITFIKNVDSMYKWSMEVAKEHGPVFRVTTGPQDSVFLNDIESVQAALIDAGMDFTGRPQTYTLRVFTEDSSIVLTDAHHPTWKARRKLLATAVRNFTVGRAYEQRVDEAIQILVKHIDEYAERNEAFDPGNYCKLFTYNLIANMCFQKSYDFDDPEFTEIREAFQEASDTLFSGGINMSDVLPFVQYLPFDLPDVKLTKRVRDKMFDYIREEIKQSKERFEESGEVDDLAAFVLKVKEESESEDDAMREVTDVELVHLIGDVFGAGVDTTQQTIRWLIVFLAVNPEVQDKILQEIEDVVGDAAEEGHIISSIDYRHEMPYSEAVILETTRSGAVVPFGVPRRATCDSKIGEYDIPKDTVLFINQWALNHDEKEFKNPWQFRPERFLTEDGKLGPRPRSYLPFGLGRRSCPGETAARNTIWMFLVTIVRKYKILPPNGEILEATERGKIGDGSPEPYKILLERRQ